MSVFQETHLQGLTNLSLEKFDPSLDPLLIVVYVPLLGV